LIIFLPAFIVIPLLIKLTSRGPIFFKQQRLGAFGRPFQFLKFRTMQVNNNEKIHSEYIKKLIREEKAYSSEKDGTEQNKTYKIKNDPRVTLLGKFLRKTSLDEIPQFFNVIKGEMSLVGPRPPIPYELENYDIWHLRRVLEFKPGITGLWQVNGRSRTTFNEMVRMDINYINKWSIWLDIKLVMATPWSLAKGAY
jgi:lipopolysaccharide/colanic/teichoic acid biosynthesis glycosyltransferase